MATEDKNARPIEAPDNSQPVIADTAGAKAIYQIIDEAVDAWNDTDWLTYQSSECEKRIVYASPAIDAAPEKSQADLPCPTCGGEVAKRFNSLKDDNSQAVADGDKVIR